MFGVHETEVLVVGAGPVGLFSALSLARHGVRVQIVDEQFRTAAHSYALALHSSSLGLLHEVGVAEELIERGTRVDTVGLYDRSRRRAEMKLSELSGPYPFLLVLPQSAVEALLERQLRQRGVPVEWNHRVSSLRSEGRHVIASIDKLAKVSRGYAVATTEWIVEKTRRTRADFVIGADGHRSRVREALGIQFAGVGSAEPFAVFEFHSDTVLPKNEVRIVLDEKTTNVLWPLPGDRWRWSFEWKEGELSEELRMKNRLAVPIGGESFPHLSGEALTSLIEERAAWFKGSIRDIDWSMTVRFERRLASGFGRDRLWLAGDAAHLTGPVGIQSANAGLTEAGELGSLLTRILRENASLGLLVDYGDSRLKQWRQLLGIEGGLTASSKAEPWIAQNTSRIAPCIPATGEDFVRLASQLGLQPEAAP
jgi:2-polyprenyl-6-methoxyphenol hydroxylase-like FAD-dependent oxidoreductase